MWDARKRRLGIKKRIRATTGPLLEIVKGVCIEYGDESESNNDTLLSGGHESTAWRQGATGTTESSQ